MGLELPEPVLAGRCRCGAGKFLRCGCAGARVESYQCQGLGMGSTRPCWEQHLVALGHDRRDALCSGTLLVLHLGGFILNPAVFVVPSPL